MSDKPQINRSLNTIRTELEYLRDAGVLNPAQFSSITAQLPQAGGIPSQYVDPHYTHPPPDYGNMTTQIAQQAQDPNHPAHPQHKDHHKWASGIGKKFANAALFGAGATAGSDLVNKIF